MLDFVDFVAKFPPVKMPVTLGEDTHHTFSTENGPLSDALIAQFIGPLEKEPIDEYTEYVPCFAIDCDEKYIALVWWKAELLLYQYVLAIFNEKGVFIDQKMIAFTLVDGHSVKRAVCTIDEELSIHIAEGTSIDDVFEPGSSLTRLMEILPNGVIVVG
jgi:hypothetical protein